MDKVLDYSLMHTFIPAMQGAGLPIRSNFRFSVRLKDTTTSDQEEPGIKPPALIYLPLKHSCVLSMSYD